MSKMQVVYALEVPPEQFTSSIFLAGPSPRDPSQYNWRLEALEVLKILGYDGVVFVPLPRGGNWAHEYEAQVEWEAEHLNMSDVVVFWVPRSDTLPGFTTNVEYGMYFDSGKAVLGYPPGAGHMSYLAHHGKAEGVPVYDTLEDTLASALERVWSPRALREGGERSVPLHIWKLPHFQGWLKAQKAAGNRLDGAKLLWSFRVGPNKGFTFAYAMHVNVHITSEGRNKTNEFILSRPDIATIVAYRKRDNIMDTDVVLIKEFRSPSRTSDGFIREAPGGSSWKPGEDPFTTAAHELSEETGFSVDPSRLRKIGARQLCGILSTHQAHVFACEITEGELSTLRKQQEDGAVFGVAGDTERTYIEVHRLSDLLTPESNAVDWSMLGMILIAVS